MEITFTVPGETTTSFVVAVDRAPSGLTSVLPWRVAKPQRRQAAKSLGTPRLEVTRHRASRSPVPLGKEFDEDDGLRLRKARHHIIVTSTASPADQPQAAQVARAAARALAEAYEGTIIDPLTGNAVFHCPDCAGEPDLFHLDDDWLGWSIEPAASPGTRPGDGPRVGLAIGPGSGVGVASGVRSGVGLRGGAGAGPGGGIGVTPGVRPGVGPRGGADAGPGGGTGVASGVRSGVGPRGGAGAGPGAGLGVASSGSSGVGGAIGPVAECGTGAGVGDDGAISPWGGGDGCGRPEVTSRGLSRFGLPEITLEWTACAHSLCVVDVLHTVAQHLLSRHLIWADAHPQGGLRAIPNYLSVEGVGVALFTREPFDGRSIDGRSTDGRSTDGPHIEGREGRIDDGQPFRVRLTPYDADRLCLRVGPPHGYAGNGRVCRPPSDPPSDGRDLLVGQPVTHRRGLLGA